MDKFDYDVIIIGSGPAGSSLARILNPNLKVLLVDKRALDNEPSKLIKNCGGLIAPDAQKALASFGLSIPKSVLVSPQMFSVETLDFDNDMVRSYQRHYINVDRERYDRWLVSLCGKNIKKSFGTRYIKSEKYENGLKVTLLKDGVKQTFSTRILVGADGANSRVKKEFIPVNNIKKYISIQEWFENTEDINQFVAMFDEEISDFYSWIIPKDDHIIFGSAVQEGRDATTYHNLQKKKLEKYGYKLNNPIKREGCYLLRPTSPKYINLGDGCVALIGEAGGLISPTSAEGISYAMISGCMLGDAINENIDDFLNIYKNKAQKLKNNISSKMLKYPAMYNKNIRKMIFKLGVGSIEIRGRK